MQNDQGLQYLSEGGEKIATKPNAQNSIIAHGQNQFQKALLINSKASLEKNAICHTGEDINHVRFFLHRLGLKIQYDITSTPPRVVEVLVRCAKCSVPSYSKLVPTDVYVVLTSSFLIEGGDGFNILDNIISRTKYGLYLLQSVSYLRSLLQNMKNILEHVVSVYTEF